MGGVSMVLSDLVDVIGGGTPKTTEESYWNGSIPWLSVKDFCGDKKYVYNTEKSITEEGLNNSSTKLLHKDNIIISARGTVGELAMIPYDMAFNQSCFGLIPKGNNDPHFVYYLLKDKVRSLKSQTQGSVFDTITKATFDRIECADYSEEDQRRIASILSSLDRKIELNNKINADLEEMAQAIFKNWFVDFEPFKDGKFVDSELGMIPEGWKVGCLGDMGAVVCGKTPSKSNSNYYGGDIPFIKIPDMHGNVFVENSEDRLTEEGSLSQIKKFIPPYSLMVSCIATVGLVSINTKPSHTNQQINTVIPHNKSALFYLYQYIKNNEELLKNMGRGGTTTLNVNTRSFSNIRLLIPSEIALEQFHRVVEGLFKKIELNLHESRTLSLLRDTLLPRLMSGELEVPE
ncbi:restriction endonuclease subunit S [Prevotella copri]|uniref:Restriction endonuclease subunit S n=1 Tax=Segatella copri TaxID=165179 RepID=A0AAW4NEV8_9BACT|nr:restriction endonuclease subunit S [Segatella copri]MBU9912098.1 restriction endonuclease subunit S [Segatella copri]MBV3399899.1 restriction endonuclease subunit S [Segatella copri]MBV3409497.1 restriction endonuclease subunit S [Segatella copri]MBV3412448.1 restriction endonuclease subunit S [Segatella copri]MBV3420872.1 restriction endonuclease subunit S [Segatella copri]